MNAGTAFVDVVPRMTGFAAGVAKGMGGVAGQLSRTGGALTKGLSLPLAAAGAASVKMALDFDTAFTKISAVSNASRSDISKWRGEVLKMAGRTARSPQELGNALYFLASAGLEASQIMPTLEASAKAAAVGLGETQDVARLLAQVVTTYGPKFITAAKAADILVAAVKAGTAEPAEFADAMGRILPIAQAAGVEFQELAASLAGLSNIGLDVNEGVTAMRGLLNAMVAPGTQAAKAMNELGISSVRMRDVLSKGGLLAAMQLLVRESKQEWGKGWLDGLRKIVPNVRALTGELGLTGKNADQVALIFEQVANSTGSLDEAFKRTAQSAEFKFRQAFSRLQVAAIGAGQQMLPALTKIVASIGRVARSFGRLSPETQAFILKAAGITILIGPFLKVAAAALSIGKAIGLWKFGAAIGGLLRLGDAMRALPVAVFEARTLGIGSAVQGLVTRFGRLGTATFGTAAISAGIAALDDMKYSVEDVSRVTGLNLDVVRGWQSEVTARMGYAGGVFHSFDKVVTQAGQIYMQTLQSMVQAGVPFEEAQRRLQGAAAQAGTALGGFGGGLTEFRQKLLQLVDLAPRAGLGVQKLAADVRNVGAVFGPAVAGILKGEGAVQGFIRVFRALPKMSQETAQGFATMLQELATVGINLKNIGTFAPSVADNLRDALKAGDAKAALSTLTAIRGAFASLSTLGARVQLGVTDDATPKIRGLLKSLGIVAKVDAKARITVADRATAGLLRVLGFTVKLDKTVARPTVGPVRDKVTAGVKSIAKTVSSVIGNIGKSVAGIGGGTGRSKAIRVNVSSNVKQAGREITKTITSLRLPGKKVSITSNAAAAASAAQRSMNSVQNVTRYIYVRTVQVPHGGGLIPLTKFHEGGLAALGRLGAREYPAIVKAGEFWFDETATRNLTPAFLSALQAMGRSGGLKPAPIAPARSSSSSMVGTAQWQELHVTGTLDTPFGPAHVEGVARAVARDERRRDTRFEREKAKHYR